MSDLQKLIDAVEAGKHEPGTCWLDHGLHEAIPSGVFHVHQMAWVVQAYEGSLDAAKSLHEALLPGWDCLLNSRANYAQVWEMKGVGDANADAMSVHGGLSRAWLLAVLKAYEATQ